MGKGEVGRVRNWKKLKLFEVLYRVLEAPGGRRDRRCEKWRGGNGRVS